MKSSIQGFSDESRGGILLYVNTYMYIKKHPAYLCQVLCFFLLPVREVCYTQRFLFLSLHVAYPPTPCGGGLLPKKLGKILTLLVAYPPTPCGGRSVTRALPQSEVLGRPRVRTFLRSSRISSMASQFHSGRATRQFTSWRKGHR